MGCFLGPKGYSQGQVVWSVRVQHMCSASACLPVSPIPRFKTSHWMMTLARLRYVYNLLQHVLFNLDIIQYSNVYIYIIHIGFYRIVIIHFHPICLKMKPFTNTKAPGSRHLFQRFSPNEPLTQQWINFMASRCGRQFFIICTERPTKGRPFGAPRAAHRQHPVTITWTRSTTWILQLLFAQIKQRKKAAEAHSLDNGRSQVCEIDWKLKLYITINLLSGYLT